MTRSRLVAVAAVVTLPVFAGAAAAQVDLDCNDFPSHEQAQAYFLQAGPGDPHNLDEDDDGVACDLLRSARAESRAQILRQTSRSATAKGGALPETGGPIAAIALAGFGLTPAGVGLIGLQRVLERRPERLTEIHWERC